MPDNPTPAPRKEGSFTVVCIHCGKQNEIGKIIAPLLARAECAEKLIDIVKRFVQPITPLDAVREYLLKDCREALAAWDSIKKEGGK